MEKIILAVRIYALAKELKVDSKELVDICTKVGIRGKGSALASLSEDEVAKLRDHFSGGGAKDAPGSTSTAAPVPERPKERPRGSAKMPVISAPRPSSPLSGFRKSKETEPEAEPAAEAPAVAEPEAASASPASSPEAAGAGPLAGVMRRDDYVGPGGVKGKPPVLGETKPAAKEKEQKPGPGNGGQRARPAVKLAPMPEVEPQAPKTSKGSEAQPTQKPDLSCLLMHCEPARLVASPLAAHLRRHEESLETTKSKKRPSKTLPEDEGVEEGKGRREKGKRSRSKGGNDEDAPMLGGREQRQLNRRRSTRSGDDDRPARRTLRRTRKSGVSTAAPRKEKVSLQLALHGS